MRRKLLITLGIIVLSISTFLGGAYIGQSYSEHMTKIPILSACVHTTDGFMLRFLVSGGEDVGEAEGSIEVLNLCWTYTENLPSYFESPDDKLKIEQLTTLVEGYGNLVQSILEREDKLNAFLNMSMQDISPTKERVIGEMTKSLMSEQLEDVERTKIFLRSIDKKLIEIWE